jgi:hypothetical protein
MEEPTEGTDASIPIVVAIDAHNLNDDDDNGGGKPRASNTDAVRRHRLQPTSGDEFEIAHHDINHVANALDFACRN